MPKLDVQGRIIIPAEFRDELSWKLPKKVALCYDFHKDLIYIHEKENCTNEFVVCFRTIDSKGRISFPEECIRLLKASNDDFFVLFLQNNQILIKKA